MFPAVCAEAAADPEAFASFKRHPEVRVVIESFGCDDGRRNLELAIEQTPSFANMLDRFRENDQVGLPRMCNYGVYGDFSPTTLRYVKVASDLLTLFGPLETAQMIEIGGGYGGQCYVTSVALSFSSYTLVDLDPVLELQRVYLRALRIPSVRFVSPRDIDAGAEYDLVVSNFAFSECVRRVQKFYIERVLSRSRCGYVACNWLRPRTSLTKRELLEAVPGSRFVRDNEGAPSGFDILVWGSG